MMRMNFTIREWLPAGGAMLTVIAAVVFAVLHTSEVSSEIRNMDELAAELSSRADRVQKGVRTSDEIDHITQDRKDLELRMIESGKPGLVVPQLSEAARAAGVLVLEIQPLALPSNPNTGGASLPNYRVSLKGGYQQIAKYLNDCTRQRIPVRVVGFEITRYDESDPHATGDELRADIVVEAFQSRAATDKGQRIAS